MAFFFYTVTRSIENLQSHGDLFLVRPTRQRHARPAGSNNWIVTYDLTRNMISLP